MTLQAGNKKNEPRPRRAFTLLELMLVMAMLLIVLSVTFPSLKNFFRARNIDSEARRFLSLTRYGQSRAISEGVPMMLWIDAKQGTYGVQPQIGYSSGESNTLTFSLDQTLQVEVPTAVARVFTESNLWTQTSSSAGNLPMIRFLPDGSISETSPEKILLRQGAEDALWIAETTNRLQYEIQPGQIQKR